MSQKTKQLTDTTVRRGGSTAKNWYGTIEKVFLVGTAENLTIKFSMPSKGGGDTDVEVQILPADFKAFLEFMCAVDRQVALKAMSTIMCNEDRQAALQVMGKAFELKGIERIFDAVKNKRRRSVDANERAVFCDVENIILSDVENILSDD